MKLLARLRFLAAVTLLARPARAIDIGPPGEPMTLEVHGFVSQGFILTSGNHWLARSKHGSFEMTEVGLNFTVPVTDRLRVGMQLFARDLGRLGNYSAKMDWFYLDYRFRDWLGFRAGRTKLPFGLYNEFNDIDSGRVPVLLPQSVYPTQNRDFLLAQTGAEVYGRIGVGVVGALDYRAYAGTIFLDLADAPSVQIDRLDVPFVVGGRVLWETPLEGLRLGGSLQSLRLDSRFRVPAAPAAGPIDVEIPATLWVASTEYAWHDLLLAAEYSRWHTRTLTSQPALFPATATTSERAYGMASYRVASWFHPGTYYAVTYPDVAQRTGRDKWQHDVALTLRFDLNTFWLLKLEGHLMHGTAGLSSALNDGAPLTGLERTWGVFLAKTTAYF